MVFDLVIRPAFELLTDLGPAVAHLVMEFVQGVLLLSRPIGVVYSRVKLVVPSELVTKYL